MAVTGGSVILETTDREAAKIAFAADNARLWFLLRPPVGAKDSKPRSVNQESIKNFSLTVTEEATESGRSVTITGNANSEGEG